MSGRVRAGGHWGPFAHKHGRRTDRRGKGGGGGEGKPGAFRGGPRFPTTVTGSGRPAFPARRQHEHSTASDGTFRMRGVVGGKP